MSDNRPIAYLEDGHLIVRASSLGRGVRCLTLAARGHEPTPPPDYLQKAADAGTAIEPVVLNALRDGGWHIPHTGQQGSIELHVGDRATIRGHLDAYTAYPPKTHTIELGNAERLDDHDGPVMIEVKSMSDRVFDKWLRWGFGEFPSYAFQLTAYMRASNRPALYAVIRRSDNQLALRFVDHPPVPYSAAVKKVLAVRQYLDAGDGSLPTCDNVGYSCAYQYMCDVADVFPFGDELESGTAEVVESLAVEYEEVRVEMRALEGRKAQIRDDLIVALAERERVIAGPWSVTHTAQKRKRLDESALRSHLGDALDGFYTESESPTLRVTKRGSS